MNKLIPPIPPINYKPEKLPTNTQTIVQQEQSFARLLNEMDISKKTAFERTCFTFPEYFSLILDISNIKDIFRFRLISNIFYEYVKLYLIKNSITLSVNSIEEAKTQLLEPKNAEIFILDISKIDVSSDTINDIYSLFKLIVQNKNSFPNMNTLVMGDIYCAINFALPDIIKTLKVNNVINRSRFNKFSNSSGNLENLIIKCIEIESKLTMDASFINLKVLKIGQLKKDSTFFLTQEIQKLQTLCIEAIYDAAKINLIHFINLTSVTFGEIKAKKVTFSPKFFSNLRTLTLCNASATLPLPDG